MTTPTIALHRPRRLLARALASGLAAGGASAALLAWRGRRENGGAPSALNAPSHWLWGDEALRHDEPSLRYTAVGAAIHQASSLLWAAVYEALQARHARPSAAKALGDAAAVTALAAVVDLKLVPPRLTPGFERRLSSRSLLLVYGGFAAGLALAGLRRLHR